jgi:hypothetical protein
MNRENEDQTQESEKLKRYFNYVNQDERKTNLKSYHNKGGKLKVVMIAEKPSIAEIIAKALSNNVYVFYP